MIRKHGQPEEDVLNLDEAAELLKVSGRTLGGLAKDGEVPSRRVGKQYRFSRSQLLAWIRSSNNNEQSEVNK
jgi:excisionase family DNA binding protein